MREFLKKLTSRKFIAAIAGIVVGVLMYFGVGIDVGAAKEVSGAVISVLSIVSYILTEGAVDIASILKKAQETIPQVEEAIDAINKIEDCELDGDCE